jgi:hypothetical protein
VAAVGAVVAAVASVRAITAIVEDKVAASLLGHRELLESLRQPMDPEGETLHAWVFIHFMMCLVVEGHTNIFKLFEGSLEQVDGKLGVVKERFLVGVHGRQLLPLLQLPPTAAFVIVVLPSPPLHQRWAPRCHLLIRDLSVNEDFVVADREEEEEVR